MFLQMKACARTLACTEEQALAAISQPSSGLGPLPKPDAEFSGGTCEDGPFIGSQRVEDFREPVEAEAVVDR
ncbi:hypothetical protein [Streptomyces sp. NBC_00986]|uniref:hypothetical protein n=1 Tax=Streptomyces sp. NBC_00986 TaxID=2903702 RepID=UPI003865DFD8|nr:hypothetical protein OG504_00760 [Streptomyces sp. NBC_00986]